MTDAELMAQIHSQMGDYIAGACEGTAIAPAFVAALVANESAGVMNATRFEPAVFAELARVATGQKPAYEPAGIKAPIGGMDLNHFCAPARQLASVAAPQPVNSFSQSLMCLINLATSWGPTQIMGWHALELGFPMGDLTNIAVHFERTVQILDLFIAKYDLACSFAYLLKGSTWPQTTVEQTMVCDLFRCWNTGKIDGKTFDPNYVGNGLDRMAHYAEIGASVN